MAQTIMFIVVAARYFLWKKAAAGVGRYYSNFKNENFEI
jgi:uncharacterized protein (DUF608 family)